MTRLGPAGLLIRLDATEAVIEKEVLAPVFGGVRCQTSFSSGRGGSGQLTTGGIEPDEHPDVAALRELGEETGLVGRISRELWTLQHADRTAHYYLTTVDTTGTMRLDGPELASASPDNSYEPAWVSLSELDSMNLQPVVIWPLLEALVDKTP